ncbi:amino acid permease [Aquicella lusitana]|uniref:Amino acid/polyamine/organocation transporter (APC superfamily) n=1 Tax=Aquicella lusitana TaxID=254246 RepID=A0A370GFJ8_9COXI|nr:amino acid permease [Aquicella lusitana]RDI42070.1 amino acid/polyamine/organocation transporter (APC superfamily) [Aquicella lusitana]VVC74423.1 Glutamate/gamma-aminobutyrate antiporter [Aquicella lusitana]
MSVQARLSPGKSLGIFSLVMINVIAVDNLRSLTAGAEYGFALVFFYLLAAALFFIPTLLVTAELATGWPNTGGAYVWIREAFGPRWGFLSIWLQWIYNVVWYPTIFAFIAGVLASLIQPHLTNNKFYMLSVILTAFWGVTLINCQGIRISQWISTIGALLGTIAPMLFIACLGGVWLYLGKPSQIHFTMHDFFPNLSSMNNLAFLTNILFGLMGIEMSAVHAGDVREPSRDYPRALIYSSLIIMLTLIFACLAIAIVVPVQQLNLVSGLIDAYGIFFSAYHMSWFAPIIAILIIVGSLSGAAAWIIGPARGLLVACEDNDLPKFFRKRNLRNMPIGILLVQGAIVTALSTIFLIMPSVNSSYWVLSNLTAQLALLFYIFMFAAAIRLRYKYARIKRAFQIPGGLIGIWLVGGVGIATCIGAIILGFLPPTQVVVGNLLGYEAIFVFGIIACCLPPLLFYKGSNETITEQVCQAK